jgi:hypothetical protein
LALKPIFFKRKGDSLLKQLRKRLTYANVMSSIAVFFVLTGATAFAATQLAKNSVGSKQLKKNAVTAAKIKNNAVTSAKIRNGAVTGAKVNLGSLGTVPSAQNAAHANTANSAGAAGSINGQAIHKVLFRTTSDLGSTGDVNVFNAGGLAITVNCTLGEITATASTSKTDSSIYIRAFDSGSAEVSQEIQESGEFDTGETVDLLAGNEGNNDLILFEYDAVDGTVVTGIVNSDTDGALDGCRLTGHATVG